MLLCVGSSAKIWRVRGRRHHLLVLCGVFVAATIAHSPGADAVPGCMGRAATIVGTPGRDVIEGTKRADVIVALKGRDEVRGRGGRDVICMNGGGGYRVDIEFKKYAVYEDAYGGGGGDVIDGGPGFEILRGGPGADVLRSRSSPTSSGACCDDNPLFGQGGDDVLRGGPTDDLLFGGHGSDQMFGGDAVDSLFGGIGDDAYHGGRDVDQLEMFSKGTRRRLLINLSRGIARGEGSDHVDGVEWVYSKVDTEVIGDGKNNRFYLAAGDDRAYGGPGADFISDIGGRNRMYGGAGPDTMAPEANVEEVFVDGGRGSDFLDVGECTVDPPVIIHFDENYYECFSETHPIEDVENYRGTYAVEHVFGDEADNFISGGGRQDEIRGGRGEDVLKGGVQRDTIYGDDGDDHLDGQKGFDFLDGGEGQDTCSNGETVLNCP